MAPYVVVTGPPGSGKSTLSRALAHELGPPLLAKDDLKQEPLAGGWPVVEVDTTGPVDVAGVVRRVLGR